MSVRTWVEGARPRTLPAALVPVLVGTSVALEQGQLVWWRAPAALLVAVAIQVGTNYANDYADGVRGTDAARVGPTRLVAAGLASPAAVRAAALVSFGVAGVAGLSLAWATSWWLVLVGAACLAAGWFYTGGPRPYGYAGLGEVFVFAFFGLVATVGSAWVHLEEVTALAVFAAVPVGLLATALLVINNLRDIPTDRVAGKLTLAVRLGDGPTRRLYEGLVVVAVGWPGLMAAAFLEVTLALALVTAVRAVPLTQVVRAGAQGPALVPVLIRTGQLQLLLGLTLSVGIVLS